MNKEKLDSLIVKFIEFVQKGHEDIEIEGIIVFGSVLHQEQFGKRSDVDVYVVIKNNGKRYRGVWIIDGIEFDYFVNPVEQLQVDIENAKISGKNTVLYLLADGKIIQDDNGDLLKLKNKAKEVLREKSKTEMTKEQKMFALYFINDYLKDTKDAFDNEDLLAWQQNMNLLLDYLLDTFCMLKQIKKVKPKYQKAHIQEIDAHFIKLYEDVVKSNSQFEKQELIEKLAEYVVDQIGMKSVSDWEVVTDVKL